MRLLGFGYSGLDGFEVFELELVVDNLLVAHGVDAAVHVGDVVIIETAQDVQYGICFSDVGEEFVAETFAAAGAFDQAGDVYDLDGGGDYRARIAHFHQACQTVVRNGDDADVGLDGTERKIG